MNCVLTRFAIRLLGFTLLAFAPLGCLRKDFHVTISCNARQDYATDSTQAIQRLLGTWQLTSIGGYTKKPIPTPNVRVIFQGDGTCLILENGQTSPPFPYTVRLQKEPYGARVLPFLQVQDSTQAKGSFRLLRAVLFVCEENMVLDYGSAVDGPAAVYRRAEP